MSTQTEEPALHRLRMFQPGFDRIVKAPTSRLRLSLRISNVAVGDQLQLLEYDLETRSYSGAFVVAKIVHVTDLEQQPGILSMGIRILRRRYQP